MVCNIKHFGGAIKFIPEFIGKSQAFPALVIKT